MWSAKACAEKINRLETRKYFMNDSTTNSPIFNSKHTKNSDC